MSELNGGCTVRVFIHKRNGTNKLKAVRYPDYPSPSYE